MGNFLGNAATIINNASPYISAATSAYGAYNTYRSGVASEAAARIEAKAVEDSARDDEIQRKRALIASLSAQNAIAGSRGITTGGSFGALQRTDIRDAQNDLLRTKASATAKMRALRERGRAIRTEQEAKAGSQLFGGLQQFAIDYVPPGGP